MADLECHISPLDSDCGSENVELYTYHPLKDKDSIRLLKLGPNSTPGSEELKCEMIEVQQSEQPEYEAISYTWGDSALGATLMTQSGVIRITQNLAVALGYLALRDKPRFLWADAICINQADVSERSWQVTIMGQIYQYARRVLVWLGPGDERTGHVFDLFRVLSSRAQEYGVDTALIDTAELAWGTFADEPTQRVLLDNVPIDYDFNGTDEFYSNDWFQRLWVVQEIVLASDIQIYCGRNELSWKDFLTAATIQYKSVARSTLSNLRLPRGFGSAMTIFNERSRFKRPSELKLLSSLIFLRNNQCSLDLDRIYAVTNLRGPKDKHIFADYTKSVPEVYISAAETMVVLQTQLLLLAGVAPRMSRISSQDELNLDADKASHIHRLCEELPSWVPDWRIPGAHPSFFLSSSGFSAATGIQSAVARYQAPSLNISQPVMPPHGAFLDVKGMLIDIVRLEKGFGNFEALHLEQVRERVLEIKDFYDSQSGKILTYGEDELTTFARAITGDSKLVSISTYLRKPLSKEELIDLWLRFEHTPYRPDDQVSRQFEADAYSQPRPAGSGGKVYALSELYAYRLALKEALNDRTFFITNQGVVGLAPAMVRSGDIVVLIAGLAVPVILRPTQLPCAGTYTWYLVGDCYSHGIMYGDFFKLLDSKSLDGNWRIYSLA